MRDRSIRTLFIAWFALGLLGTPAGAGPYWLCATNLCPRPGDPIDVGAMSGDGFRGETRYFDRARCEEFSWVTYRPFTMAPMAQDEEARWGHFTFTDRGGTWLQYCSDFLPIEFASDDFDAYLLNHGLFAPLRARRKLRTPTLGRERYRRCAKLWLAGDNLRTCRRELGLPLEIVPETPPGEAAKLRVRVLWQGRALPGAMLQTWRQPLAADGRPRVAAERESVSVFQKVRTNANGEAVLDVREPGEWLVNVVHMVPCEAPEVADWESTWSSLTFARPSLR